MPPGFDCRIAGYGADNLNPLHMWMNAINAVYILSAIDMRHVWHEKTWSLPAYDVNVIANAAGDTEEQPLNLQTRFIIWSIQHIMFNVWHLNSYKAVAGVVEWQGNSVGLVRFWKKGVASSISGINHNNDTRSIVRLLTAEPNTTDAMNLSSRPEFDATDTTSNPERNFRIVFQYEGSTVNSAGVFLAALEGIGEAAEEGLDTRCEDFFVHGFSIVTFTLTSRRDRFGNALMRYDHVRIALKRMVFQMVADRRFHEMKVIILQPDGQEIAEGGCKKWFPSPALSGATAK